MTQAEHTPGTYYAVDNWVRLRVNDHTPPRTVCEVHGPAGNADDIADALNSHADLKAKAALVDEMADVLQGWLPIAQRQLDGLLTAAEAHGGAEQLHESAAWKAANERVDSMRAVLAKHRALTEGEGK